MIYRIYGCCVKDQMHDHSYEQHGNVLCNNVCGRSALKYMHAIKSSTSISAISILIICLLLSDHQISIRALYGQIGFSITKYIDVSGFFVVQICLQFSTCRGVFDLSTFFR